MEEQIDAFAGELGRAAQRILFSAGRWKDLNVDQKTIVNCWIERSSAQYERMVALENVTDYLGDAKASSVEHRFSGLLDELGPDALSDDALRRCDRAVRKRRRQAIANMTLRDRAKRRELIKAAGSATGLANSH